MAMHPTGPKKFGSKFGNKGELEPRNRKIVTFLRLTSKRSLTFTGLKILVSVVRFRPRPPFQHRSVTSTTVFSFVQYADLHCFYDQHTLATVKFRDLSWTD